MLQMSRFLRVRQRGADVVVFHEIHSAPSYFQADIWRSFTINPSCEPEVARVLCERRLLVASREEDDEMFASAINKLHHKLDQPQILYLMLAQGCNFACKYCPIPRQAILLGENLMSPAVAKMGIELWAEHMKDAGENTKNTIIFYGGEPLLNKPTLQSALTDIRSMKAAGRLPLETDMLLVTNGKLVDDTILGWCREYGMNIMVGIDGCQASTNSFRLDVDGNETFAGTIAVIRKLVLHRVRTFVSASITPGNLGEVARLPLFLKSLGVEKFGLNFLKGRGLASSVLESERDGFEHQCAVALVRNYHEGNGNGYEYQLARKVAAFKKRDYFPVDCTCYGNQLVVQADGQISNCPFFRANLGFVGSVGHDFRIAKTQIVADWRRRLPLVNEFYRRSEAKALCGPGCAWSVFELTGGVEAPDTMTKTFSEEVFDELIWSEYKK